MKTKSKFLGNNQFSKKSKSTLFWEKVNIRSEDECWEWIASKNHKGYGNFNDDSGNPILAHRYSWMLHYSEVPFGKLVLHYCDNPSCVNPKHLFLGTNDDNMKDMVRKGHSTKGTRSWTSKLTEDDVRYIRNIPPYQIDLIRIAKQFGVSKHTIIQIRGKKTWKWLD